MRRSSRAGVDAEAGASQAPTTASREPTRSAVRSTIRSGGGQVTWRVRTLSPSAAPCRWEYAGSSPLSRAVAASMSISEAVDLGLLTREEALSCYAVSSDEIAAIVRENNWVAA